MDQCFTVIILHIYSKQSFSECECATGMTLEKKAQHYSTLSWSLYTCLLHTPMLMRDMWWKHNAIVRQICLGITAGIWPLSCGWMGRSSATDDGLIQSQRADHRKPIHRTVAGWPLWASLDLSVCLSELPEILPNSTGRLIRRAHCVYLWATVMAGDRFKSISHFSKRPLKDNYGIPLSI